MGLRGRALAIASSVDQAAGRALAGELGGREGVGEVEETRWMVGESSAPGCEPWATEQSAVSHCKMAAFAGGNSSFASCWRSIQMNGRFANGREPLAAGAGMGAGMGGGTGDGTGEGKGDETGEGYAHSEDNGGDGKSRRDAIAESQDDSSPSATATQAKNRK